jgi:hypothetical protein
MMEEARFDRIVMSSPIANRLLLNPADIRVQIGLIIGILSYHVPPDLSYQESYRLLSNDPLARAIFLHLKVYVWEL